MRSCMLRDDTMPDLVVGLSRHSLQTLKPPRRNSRPVPRDLTSFRHGSAPRPPKRAQPRPFPRLSLRTPQSSTPNHEFQLTLFAPPDNTTSPCRPTMT